MNFIRFHSLAGALTGIVAVLTPTAAQAVDTQTAALAAGGALALVGVGVQAMTGSKLCVEVDVFADTVPLPFLPTDADQHVRSEPFRLGHSPAATALTTAPVEKASEESAQGLLTIQKQLSPIMAEHAARQRTINSNKVYFADFSSSNLTSPTALDNAFTTFASAEGAVLDAWKVFDDGLRAAADGHAISAGDLSVARERLNVLREHLNLLAQFSPGQAYFSALNADLRSALAADYRAFDATHDAAKQAKVMADFASKADPSSAASTYVGAIAGILDALRQVLPQTGDKHDEVQRALQDWSLRIDVAQLARLESVELIRLQLTLADLGATALWAAASATKALVLTYAQTTAGLNLGPISNEVLQQILAHNKAIDEITDPRNRNRWRHFDSALSRARLGNHTSVIYLENMATPVLKTADFDPSAFIRANGKIYQNTFKSAVALFGAPLTPATTADGKPDPAAHGLDQYNITTLHKQQGAAERKTRDAQMKLLDALRQVIDQAKKTTTPSTNDEGDAGAKLLRDLAAKLGPPPANP